MKKLILIILSVSLILILSACGGNAAPASAPVSSTQTVQNAESAPIEESTPMEEAAQNAENESVTTSAEEETTAVDYETLVQRAIDTEDFDMAVEMMNQLDPLADGGDARAKYLIGHLYMLSFFDFEQARPYLEEAAQSGLTEAYEDMGRMFELGLDGTPDYAQAEAYYVKAAEAGDLHAYYRLGSMYNSAKLDGLHDFAASEQWFLKGAEQGNPDCCYGLGRLYAFGGAAQNGYGKDLTKALYYLELAGEDNADALYILGQLYHQGKTLGMPESDPVKAMEYYKRSYNLNPSSELPLIDLVELGKDLTDEMSGLALNPELAAEAFRFVSEHGSEDTLALIPEQSY